MRDHTANIHWLFKCTKILKENQFVLYTLQWTLWLCGSWKVKMLCKEIDMPRHLFVLMYILMASIRTESGETKWFPVAKVSDKKYILSLLLSDLFKGKWNNTLCDNPNTLLFILLFVNMIFCNSLFQSIAPIMINIGWLYGGRERIWVSSWMLQYRLHRYIGVPGSICTHMELWKLQHQSDKEQTTCDNMLKASCQIMKTASRVWAPCICKCWKGYWLL